MKYLFLLTLLLSGCAQYQLNRPQPTNHDYCMNPKNAVHYADYDECYHERLILMKAYLRRQRRQVYVQRQRQQYNDNVDAFTSGLQQIGRGLSRSSGVQPQIPGGCSTYTDAVGMAHTQCN